jgi:predicted RNA-binding Zn-ribbon protein involved in translation (DUF1610 family)
MFEASAGHVSEAAASRGQARALLTMHCTSCDYSLEGLPRNSKCPECGTAIDDRFLVIRGTDYGRRLYWGSVAGPFIAIFSGPIVARLLFGASLKGGAGALFFFCWYALWSPELVMTIWRKWHNDGSPDQLWLCEQGFWTRSKLDTLQGRRVRRYANGLFLMVVIAMLIWAFNYNLILGLVVTFFSALIAFGIWAMKRALDRDSRLIDVAGFGVQRCMRWRSAISTFVRHEKGDRYTIGFEPRPPNFWDYHRQAKSAFRCDLPESFADQLRSRLAQLHWIGDREQSEPRAVGPFT